MADGGAAAEPAQTLSGLSVKFTEGRGGSATWRLGCDAKRIGDKDWSPEHDSALLNALRALEALQGLPAGPRARDAAAWQRAQAELRYVRSELAAPSHKPERVRDHKCSPGYDCVGCKQVRPRLPAAACAAATLETPLHVPPRALRMARCGRTARRRFAPRPISAAHSSANSPTGRCSSPGRGAGGLVSVSPERVVLQTNCLPLGFPRPQCLYKWTAEQAEIWLRMCSHELAQLRVSQGDAALPPWHVGGGSGRLSPGNLGASFEDGTPRESARWSRSGSLSGRSTPPSGRVTPTASPGGRDTPPPSPRGSASYPPMSPKRDSAAAVLVQMDGGAG